MLVMIPLKFFLFSNGSNITTPNSSFYSLGSKMFVFATLINGEEQ